MGRGEAGLWCRRSVVLSPPHRELWIWDGCLELSGVEAKVLGIYVPSWSIHLCIHLPEKGCGCGEAFLLAKAFPEDSLHLRAFCQQQSQQLEGKDKWVLSSCRESWATCHGIHSVQNLPTSSNPLIFHSQILHFHNHQVYHPKAELRLCNFSQNNFCWLTQAALNLDKETQFFFSSAPLLIFGVKLAKSLNGSGALLLQLCKRDTYCGVWWGRAVGHC